MAFICKYYLLALFICVLHQIVVFKKYFGGGIKRSKCGILLNKHTTGGYNMLGDNIRFLRKQYNMTIEELALSLDSTYSAFSMYEINKRQPNLEMLVKIANFFNVTTDMLLDADKLQPSISPEYMKIYKKAELNKVTLEELDLALDFAIKMKPKE